MGVDAVDIAVREVILALLPPMSEDGDVVSDVLLGEEGLGFDSVALVDLLSACEDRFAIELPAEVLVGDEESPLSVGRLVTEVRSRIGQATE